LHTADIVGLPSRRVRIALLLGGALAMLALACTDAVQPTLTTDANHYTQPSIGT
jgi:hypothetical protein